MDQDVKEKWVDALRSGEYEQGQRQLRYDNRFCCLGVLCDLYAKEHEKSAWKFNTFVANGHGSNHVLPVPVRDWAGIESGTGGEVKVGDQSRCLADVNDGIGVGEKSFDEIATIIEKQL